MQMKKQRKAKAKPRRAETSAAEFPLKYSLRINLKQRRKLAKMGDPGDFLRAAIDGRKQKKGGKK